MRTILLFLFQFITFISCAQITISDMFEKGIQEFAKYLDVSQYASKTRIYSNVFPFELYVNKLDSHKKDLARYTYHSELTLKHKKEYILHGRCIFPAKDTICVRFMSGTFNKPANWVLDGTGYYTYFVYNDSTHVWEFSDFLVVNHAYFKDRKWKPRSFIAEAIKAFYDEYPSYEKSIDKKNDDRYYYYRPFYLGDFTCQYDIDSIKEQIEIIPQGTWIRRMRKRHITVIGLPNITMMDRMIKVDLYFRSFKQLRHFSYKNLYEYCYSAFFTFDEDCHDWVLSGTNISKLSKK